MTRDAGPGLIYVIFQSSSLANGGLESATQLLARLPFAPIVVTHRESEYTERWRKLGATVHVWPADTSARPEAIHRVARAPSVVAFNLKLAALVHRHRAPVVQCNDISALWHAAPGAKLGGARVVFNVRDIFPEDRSYGPRWRAAHHLADEVVCLSEDMRRTVLARFPPMLDRGVPTARVSVIYSVVDLDRMQVLGAQERSRARSELGLSDGRFEIAYVGTVCDKKDQLGFITHALPALVARVPNARVTFVGDFHPERDAYAASCAAEVTRLGLEEQARFIGYAKKPELYYQAADVVCLASKYEGLPRAMIESMACGTPVVAFDVTSAREFLEAHGCGIVASRGDWKGLVDGLATCASDRPAREAMGHRGRRTAEQHFSSAAAVSAYLDRYRKLQAS